jgi:TRAP-type C4-dicarboxylate transport system permease small subunit
MDGKEVKTSSYEIITKTLDNILIGIGAALIGIDTLAIFGAIVLRVFSTSYALLEEFPPLLMSGIAFLAIGGLLKQGRHIGVDFLSLKLRGKALARLEIIIYCAVAVASLVIIVSSLDGLQTMKKMGHITMSEVAMPVWCFYIPLVVGGVLMFIYSVELIIRRIRLAMANTFKE